MDVIHVNKDITLHNITPFYRELLKGIGEHPEVTLDFGGTTRLDFAVIQVIIAAQKHARVAEKTIRIKNLKGVIREQFKLCRIIK